MTRSQRSGSLARWLAAACSVVVSTALATAQLPADDCAAATPIFPYSSLPLATTAAATPDGSSSCGSGAPDVWYSLLVPFDGTIELRACAWPTGSTLDPLVSVHSSCPGTAANEVACSSAGLSCAGGAYLLTSVSRGSTYWIRISGDNGTSGSFNLVFDAPTAPVPINDDPADATDAGPGSYSASTDEAESQWWTPCQYAPGAGLRILWYRYVPSASGTVVVDTCIPTTDDTVLAVYDGCTLVAMNDDACGIGKNWLSYLTFPAVAGVEYLIAVREYFASYPIGFQLHINGPPHANDACATAPPITAGARSLAWGNAGSDGDASCAPASQPDVFYAFTAPTDGRLSASTCGTHDYGVIDTGDDTVLSIHAACPASAANEIACNDTASACGSDSGVLADAAVSAPIAGGRTVYLRVSRIGAASGAPVLLEIDFAPGLVFCAGDGSATACPCGNVGRPDRGCASSTNAGGARLDASGEPTVSADTFTLHADGMGASGIALYVQGTARAAGGTGVVFGDGLRCVVGAVIRLGFRTSSGGASSFGAGTGAPISIAGAIPANGATRHYQTWYRDADPSFCTAATFNLSNGLSVTWAP